MAEKTDKSVDSSGLAAIGFAVFAVVLVVAFLSYRGSDVGQLPNLLGNLGGGPLAGFEGIRDSIVGSIAAGCDRNFVVWARQLCCGFYKGRKES